MTEKLGKYVQFVFDATKNYTNSSLRKGLLSSKDFCWYNILRDQYSSCAKIKELAWAVWKRNIVWLERKRWFYDMSLDRWMGHMGIVEAYFLMNMLMWIHCCDQYQYQYCRLVHTKSNTKEYYVVCYWNLFLKVSYSPLLFVVPIRCPMWR